MRHFLLLISVMTVTAAFAQSPKQNTSLPPPQFLLCKAVQDNRMRLSCYDAVISALAAQPMSAAQPAPVAQSTPIPAAPKNRSWNIIEEAEGQPSITATLLGMNDSAEMIVRCKQNRTSASIAFVTTLSTPNRVVHQVEKGRDVEEQWKVTADGKSITSTKPIGLIRSLLDGGTLSVQVFNDAEVLASETFALGDVSGPRSKLMSGCIWPDPTVTALNRIPLPKSSPIRSTQADGKKDGTLPVWLSKILRNSGEIN